MKKWDIKQTIDSPRITSNEILHLLLKQRGITTQEEREQFLTPKDPYTVAPESVGIDPIMLENAAERIERAVKNKESIIVYADYDADGVTAGTVMWETVFAMGGKVMPYIPHREAEGYGLSTAGIDTVKKEHNANLIITVDHGITGHEKVDYAKSLGIDVIVTDHHTKSDVLPDTTIVHTTSLSGSGVSWFVAKTLFERNKDRLVKDIDPYDLLGIASIGTIADLLPLSSVNRAIASFGLKALSNSSRLGILALLQEAALEGKALTTYDISHILAPRINALGRLDHALDALRLLCTTDEKRAIALAGKLSLVNKERQNVTLESTLHAKQKVSDAKTHLQKKILVIADESYNQGIIGLIAGKLVEEHYLPSIVLSLGETISKASARSIPGFNIVEAIRSQSDLLVDVGGHPMAAGFTIETKQLPLFIQRMEEYAEKNITKEMTVRILPVDMQIPLELVTADLFHTLQQLAPFGMANYDPVFVSTNVTLLEARLVGQEGKHLKLKIQNERKQTIEAIAFNMGSMYKELVAQKKVNLAYTITNNVWNGKEKIELKIKDILINKNS